MTLKNIFTTERILWLGVVLFILFLFKRCGDKKSAQLAAIKAQSVALQQKHLQDSISFTAQVARWQDSIRTADINSQLQAGVIKETEKKLQASQSDINRLTSIIRSRQVILDSSLAILVSPLYKSVCDSLPFHIDILNQNIAQLHKDNEGLVDLMNYEVVYRDSLIEAGNEYTDRLRGFYNAQARLLTAALNQAKPRGRLLGGIGLIGNELNPLSGTKINLAYQSKGGKQYQVGGILMRGGVYYEATVLITLIK